MRHLILGLSALALCALAACTTGAGQTANGADMKATITAALADPARPQAILLAHHQGDLQQIHRQFPQRTTEPLPAEPHPDALDLQGPFQGVRLQ